MRFSQRIGKRKNKTELEKNEMSPELRNTLWTLILELTIGLKKRETGYDQKYSELTDFFRSIWIFFFKWPIDNLPIYYSQVHEGNAKAIVRDWFFKADWDLAFDFVEFCASYSVDEFKEVCNSQLKSEFSAYRFVDDKIVEINSKEEIEEIEKAISNSDKYKPVKTHLETALNLIANRKSPDYRNSIKESISAVESLCKIILGNKKTTLGAALNEIEKKHSLPHSLKAAFEILYGYTSDEAGIRHGLLENDTKVDIEEARFMLIACSAFVNYLMNKI